MNDHVANAQPTPERLLQLSWGYAPPLIIDTAIRHGFFNLLDQAPRTAAELARDAGVSLRGVLAVANALVGLGFLAKSEGQYTLTPESAAFLVAGKPGYHGTFFQHVSGQLMPNWLHLPEVVRTGRGVEAVNQEGPGAAFFAEFVESLFPLSYGAAQALGAHLNLAAATAPVGVLDLAAGSGVWGIALSRQSACVHVRAVDWPGVLAVTEKVAARHGVGDRFTLVPGDLLTAPFGEGLQVATLGHILHSEGRERSRQLLARTFAALAPGGTIAIQEFLVNAERTGPPVSLLFAVNMLVSTEQGDAFSFEEISEWLRAEGFVDCRLLPVPAVSPLILATKP